MVVPAGKKSANTMPSMSQKTVSMTITAERDAFALGMVLLVAYIPLTGISFPGRTSKPKSRLP